MNRDFFRQRGMSLLMAMMVYSLIFPSYIFALPKGANVVAGQASVAVPNTNTMNVTQGTDKTIINWQKFNIGRSEAVNFLQPNAASVALNRVVGGDPSAIYGLLTANGKLFLINANGILVGPSGRIETNGFLASTLNINDADFLSGNYTLFQMSEKSLKAIVNQGTISAGNGGTVALAAPAVDNQGQIVATLGKVAIGAGEQVTLRFEGNELIQFAVDREVLDQVKGPDGEPMAYAIDNSGKISADGGEVILSARAAYEAIKSVVNNRGVIEAKSIDQKSGTIRIDGGDRGEVVNSGTLDASGTRPGESGGNVSVTGKKVKLVHYSKIKASGYLRGGKVRVGGGFQGKDKSIRNAEETVVGSNATIQADAIERGDGGEVVIWSDDTTRFYGSISATGGQNGGDGGNAEVSGKKALAFNGYVNLSAPKGTAGTLLLDPENATVADSDGDDAAQNPDDGDDPAGPAADNPEDTSGDAASGPPDATADGSGDETAGEETATADADDADASEPPEEDTVLADGEEPLVDPDALEQILDDGTNIAFQATGNVNIDDAVTVEGGGSLSILAGGNVTVNEPVSLFGGDFSSQGVNFANFASITTRGGNVTLDHTGDVTIAATIDTGNGNFSSSGLAFDGSSGSILTGAGSAFLDHGAGVTLGSMNVGGDLSVIAGGDIRQVDALSVGGSADFTTSGKNLTDFAEDDTADKTEDTADEEPEEVVAEVEGDTDDSLPTDAEVAAIAQSILLDAENNAFGGTVTFNTSGAEDDVVVNTGSGIDLGESAVGGELAVSAAGDVTQSGSVAAVSIDMTADGSVTLSETVTATDGGVGVAAAGDLTVTADVTALGDAGNVDLAAGDAMTLTDTAVVAADGDVSIAGGSVDQCRHCPKQ